MGFFTWTFANKSVQKIYDGWDYSQKCKLPYGGYGCVLCPDGTVIEEHNYEGYGMFDGKDVYELVVDWNKDHLLDILKQKKHDKGFYYEIAKIYIKEGHDAAQQYADKCTNERTEPRYLQKDWKRCLGIEIACENNEHVPFPIKITSTPRPRKSYAELPASISCQ